MSLSSESTSFSHLKRKLSKSSQKCYKDLIFFFCLYFIIPCPCFLCLIKVKDISLLSLVASTLYDISLIKELLVDTASSSKLKIMKLAVSPAKLIALNRLVGDQIFASLSLLLHIEALLLIQYIYASKSIIYFS
jgi:hypothetical protein